MLLLGVPNATCIVFTAKRGKNQSLMVFLNRDWMMIIPVLIVVGCCGWPTLRHYDAFEFIFDLIMNWNGICSMWAKCSFILLHSIVFFTHKSLSHAFCGNIHTHTNWKYYVSRIKFRSLFHCLGRFGENDRESDDWSYFWNIDSNDGVFNEVDRTTITWCNKWARANRKLCSV